MARILMTFIFTSLLSVLAFANPMNKPDSQRITHVIYITLDGTRWQDVFSTHAYLSKFWE